MLAASEGNRSPAHEERRPSFDNTSSMKQRRMDDRYRSRSRSRSARGRSRSASREPRRRDRSPPRDTRGRPEPDPTHVLGVFGLHPETTESTLGDMFAKYGEIEKIMLVMDRYTRTSRSFGFVYFKDIDSSSRAREAMNGMEVDGRVIRVDFSTTKRPHDPTPGEYKGRIDQRRRRSPPRRRDYSPRRSRDYSPRRRDYSPRRDRDYSPRRDRSPPPRRRRDHSYSRSRSRSYDRRR